MPRSGPPPPPRLLAQPSGSWPHNQGQLLPDVPPQPSPTLAAYATQRPGEEGGGWPLTHGEQGWGTGQVRGRWAGHEIRVGLRAAPTMGHCTWLRSSVRRPPSQAQAPAPRPCGECTGSGSAAPCFCPQSRQEPILSSGATASRRPPAPHSRVRTGRGSCAQLRSTTQGWDGSWNTGTSTGRDPPQPGAHSVWPKLAQHHTMDAWQAGLTPVHVPGHCPCCPSDGQVTHLAPASPVSQPGHFWAPCHAIPVPVQPPWRLLPGHLASQALSWGCWRRRRLV